MRDSDADIAINTLNKLITQELKAEVVKAIGPSRNARRPDPTPMPSPGTRSKRRSLMPWRSGMRGILSCPGVTSWSRRTCTPAICAAGGVRVPCTACACATRTSPGWRPKCAPTACGGLDSGRSGRCRSRRIGGMSAGCRSIRLRGGAPMIYLIVDGELVDILTEMDEALAKAKALAEHAGKVEIADLVTGRRTIIKQARKGNRR